MLRRLDGRAVGTCSSSAAAPPVSASPSTRRRAATAPLLLEAHDFAKGTSSRSTKLVHGGVRYLEQGNVSLVLEALRERGLLCRNAPHLVSDLAFVVPRYKWWEGPFYGIGLKLYDVLAGKLNLRPRAASTAARRSRASQRRAAKDLIGGAMYHDAQFDDARLAFTLAQHRRRPRRRAAQLHARSPALIKTGGQRSTAAWSRRRRRDRHAPIACTRRS